jgi:hypothetical protein
VGARMAFEGVTRLNGVLRLRGYISSCLYC